MKINNENLMTNIVEGKYNAAVSDMSKSLMQMKSGDVFKGTVIDIKQNSVTLKIDNNVIINAKSLVNPDLRIGEEASFTVKESGGGQIFVEISKTGEETANFIRELLNNADMPATKENIELVKFLIDNNMPVDKKTVSDALYFKYTNETNDYNNENQSAAAENGRNKEYASLSSSGVLENDGDNNNILEKVLFLLKEDMPAEKVSVDTLNRLIDSRTGLKSEIFSLASEISKMPDNELRKKLLDIIGADKSDLSLKDVRKAVIDKLFFNDEDFKSLENLTNKFEKLFEISSKGKEIILNTEESMQNNLIKQIFDNIKNDLSFMKEINNYKQYVQIPVTINGKEGDCELHIFKNNKKNNNFSESASVLLSLDYFFIGKIDAFIEKTNRNLAFQFKCGRKETINLIKKNINELSNVLSNYGFKITSVIYKEKDENFNIVKNKDENNGKKIQNRRYSFDMRV